MDGETLKQQNQLTPQVFIQKLSKLCMKALTSGVNEVYIMGGLELIKGDIMTNLRQFCEENNTNESNSRIQPA